MELTIGSAAGERHNCGYVQIIDDQGFNRPSCDKFQEDVKLADYNRSYAVVSIIGPQSSGKSTIVNKVFKTTFPEMDPKGGRRSKCTLGVWLQRPDITEPCILVMDLEGTDGKEKQAVVRLLSRHRRKTTLMFVIRDRDDIKPLLMMSMEADKYSKFSEEDWKAEQKVILKGIEDSLKKDIERIWDSVSKPEAHNETPFSAFYSIEVVFLSHPSDDGRLKNELAMLRKNFHCSIVPGVLAGDREDVVDGSSFSQNAELMWTEIKKNKDLDLPAQKIMLATVRCEQIAKDKFKLFAESKEWLKLCEAVQTQTMSDFGKELSKMIKNRLSSYDEEATYFDRDVKLEKRKQLEEKLVQHVHPTCQNMLRRIKSESLKNFKEVLEKALHEGRACKCVDNYITQFKEKCGDARIDQANRDESVEVLRELLRDMSSYIDTVAKRMHGEVSIPKVSEPALNAATASQLAAGTMAATVGTGAGAIAPAVAAGAIAPFVALGVGIGIVAIGAVVAVGIAVADKKYRQMKKVQDYIVAVADEENQQMKEVQDHIAGLLEG